MTSMTRSMSRSRARSGAPWPGVVAAVSGLIWMSGALGSARWPWIVELLACAALIGATTRAVTSADLTHFKRAVRRRAEAERLLVALVTGFVITSLVARLSGSDALHPALYALVAALTAYRRETPAWAPLALALALEAAAAISASLHPGAMLPAAPSIIALGLRGLLFTAFAQGAAHLTAARPVAPAPRTLDAAHEPPPKTLDESADPFGADPEWMLPEASEADLITRADEAIEAGMSLLRRTLNAHTCALMWLDADGESLHLRTILSAHDTIDARPELARRGVPGSVLRAGAPVVLRDLRPGWRGLPFYDPEHAPPVRHVLGVPLRVRGDVVGMIIADRTANTPFAPTDADLIEEIGASITQAVAHGQVIEELERQRQAVHAFFDAARQLNGALTAEEVYPVALDALTRVAPAQLAALVRIAPEDLQPKPRAGSTTTAPPRLQVVRLRAEGPLAHAAAWQDLVFDGREGLVQAALKRRCVLPTGGQIRQLEPVIFTEAERLPQAHSLLIVPLHAHDATLGALVLAHEAPDQYDEDTSQRAQVVAHQIATSLHHAELYARMETMATRDALTGLSNRRAFFDRLDDVIARHRRAGRTFGLLLTDIDHFKSVNDTHGHPVGDEVLRQVAATFRECLRTTDLPARYGGEEFVVVLEETDLEGSVVIANRLREAVKQLSFSGASGPFHCTISMGVALWPDADEDAHQLIELADQALYHSKKSGRDRVTAWSDLP